MIEKHPLAGAQQITRKDRIAQVRIHIGAIENRAAAGRGIHENNGETAHLALHDDRSIRENLLALERLEIEPARGAERILGQIAYVAPRLIQAHHVQAVGVGFGGPVEADGYVWIQVVDPKGRVGWIPDRYLIRLAYSPW